MILTAIPYIDGFWPDTLFAFLAIYIGVMFVFFIKQKNEQKKKLLRKLGIAMICIGTLLLIHGLSEYRTSN